LQLDNEDTKPLIFALGVKLLLMPVLALTFLSFFQPEPLLLQVVVFEAAMPPMVSAGAIAIGAGLALRLVPALVGLGLLLSFISLPLWYLLLQLYV